MRPQVRCNVTLFIATGENMVRKIREEDREFFLAAAEEFYRSDAVEKPLSRKKLEADFNEMMRSDVYLEGFILEYEGERAGYSVITKTFQTEAAGLTVWIEDIYILAPFRGKGLGKELLNFVFDKFEGKASRFRLEAEPENEAAVRLYEKCGFRRLDYMQMVKDTDDE